MAAVWLLANLPRDGGTLKPFFRWAGFPWAFAFWVGGRLEEFDGWSLAWDAGLGALVAVAVGAACAWSRRRGG